MTEHGRPVGITILAALYFVGVAFELLLVELD
jgi:hypothetical protein